MPTCGTSSSKRFPLVDDVDDHATREADRCGVDDDSSRGSAPDGERVLLEGPHSRLKELQLVLRVAWEFIAGFRTKCNRCYKCVTRVTSRPA